MRRTHLLAVACALPLALASCSGGDAATSGASASAAAISGTVVFWDTTAPNGQSAASQELVNSFAQTYPNVNVEYTNIPAAEAEAKFVAAVQAGEAPDVIRAEASGRRPSPPRATCSRLTTRRWLTMPKLSCRRPWQVPR